MYELIGDWDDVSSLDSKSYQCGYCDEKISSNLGYTTNVRSISSSSIYICHNCNRPTFFEYDEIQYPSSSYGGNVSYIEEKTVESLYLEARMCLSVNAFTASALCSRKLLMNIAVSKGAKEGKNFFQYIDYLNSNGYLPPDSQQWVDHIRKKGNEATHEIPTITKSDAEELIDFIHMLLTFIYEFPYRIKKRTEHSK